MLVLLALLAFAANSLLARAALRGDAAAPAPYTLLRLAAGALVLAILVARRRTPAATPAPRTSFGGAVALVAYAIAFSAAYVRIDTGIGALLLFGAVQLTMQGATLLRGDRPRVAHWVGLALAFSGVVVLVRPGLSAPPLGAATLMLVAGVAWGAYSLLGRGVPDVLRATRDHFVRGTALMLVVAACWPGRWWMSREGALLAVASGAVASGLGYAVWYAALRQITPATAALLQLAVPPLAALGGVVLLGESPTLRLAISTALVLGGIALALRASRTTGPR
jgi:drug/metabolite transporter (DMT)-like permease